MLFVIYSYDNNTVLLYCCLSSAFQVSGAAICYPLCTIAVGLQAAPEDVAVTSYVSLPIPEPIDIRHACSGGVDMAILFFYLLFRPPNIMCDVGGGGGDDGDGDKQGPDKK